MSETTRPPGPAAFLYARLSYEEWKQNCPVCEKEWAHTRGVVATCPKCGWQTKIDLPNSIERQSDRMLHWCKARWDETARPNLVVVPDLQTAFKSFMKREETTKVLANSKPGDSLILCKYDRGWRNSQDFHLTVRELDTLGITLVVIDEQYDTSTAIGRFMVNQSIALAQLERDRTSERTKLAIKWRRDQGLSSGNHTKFGTKVTICQKTGKKIVVDDENELRMAKWVYEMRFINQVPWDKIVTAAEQLGFRNRAGKPFNYNKLKDMGTDARKLKASGKLDSVT